MAYANAAYQAHGYQHGYENQADPSMYDYYDYNKHRAPQAHAQYFKPYIQPEPVIINPNTPNEAPQMQSKKGGNTKENKDEKIDEKTSETVLNKPQQAIQAQPIYAHTNPQIPQQAMYYNNQYEMKQPEHMLQPNYYMQPHQNANHGGSFRQTLNPAIYNAYRMSNNNPQRNSAPLPQTRNGKSPVVQVIETYYRIPTASSRAMKGKQERYDKTALYKTVCKKTELCTNWMLTGSCTYGTKCHFAHGVDDLKPRMRVENYKTQPCCDPAREGCRRCMYGRRCNYCHPGEAIRRPHPTPYYDKDYYDSLKRDFGEDNEYPFGIYI